MKYVKFFHSTKTVHLFPYLNFKKLTLVWGEIIITSKNVTILFTRKRFLSLGDRSLLSGRSILV